MFQAIRRSDKRCKVARCPAVHGNSIAKVRMGIEQCRADPDRGRTGIFLDCGDRPVFNDDISRKKRELFPGQDLSGDDIGAFFHTAYLSFIYRKMKYICMAKKQGGRLLSSAGLVNYYESEDRRAVHISPIAVMVVAAAIGIIIMTINIVFPG
jgi:preprotein translocase subunit Sec61beta